MRAGAVVAFKVVLQERFPIAVYDELVATDLLDIFWLQLEKPR